MKKNIIYLSLGLLVLLGCKSGNHLQRVTLTNKMYSFFTATLRENYYSTNEEDLYRRFLIDYMNQKQGINKIDNEKLYVICDELFKRDSTHYYFYYPELIEFKSKGNANSANFFNQIYQNTPIIINRIRWTKDGSDVLSANECPVVYLNMHNDGYFNKIDTLKHPSIGRFRKYYETNGQLDLLVLARFYAEGEGASELKEKEIRKFLAIAYWKVLCAQVNADFHGINDLQKKKYIQEFLKTEPLELVSTADEMMSCTTGYMDYKGDTIIPVGKYSYCYSPEFDTIAIVGFKDKPGFYAIDRGEKVLFQVQLCDNGPDYIKNNLFRIIKNEKTGYANMQGKIVIKPQFDFALPFNNGFAVVAIGGSKTIDGEYTGWQSDKFGIIDTTGNFVVQPVYEGVRNANENGDAKVKKNGEWKVIKLKTY